ncbi:MAG: DUF503 domain-containing protein [Frankia sp.]
MWTGTLVLELLLGDVHSLKEKRSIVRPVLAELRRRFAVSAAEAGHLDLHRRALLGVAVVGADRAHCAEVIDACERLVAGRPEFELLSARVRFLTDEDLEDDHDLGAPRGRAASLEAAPRAGRHGRLSGHPTPMTERPVGDDRPHHRPAPAGDVTTTGGCHG